MSNFKKYKNLLEKKTPKKQPEKQVCDFCGTDKDVEEFMGHKTCPKCLDKFKLTKKK